MIQVGNRKCLSGYGKNRRIPIQEESPGTDFIICLLAADGTCIVWSTDVSSKRSISKLTGPELDRITSVSTSLGNVYTTSRDGNVRVYSATDFAV